MMNGTEAFTTLHFVLMGLLAALVIVAIAAGVRKQRARAAAEREVEAHAAEAGVEVAPPEPEAPSPAPPAPAPPRIADQLTHAKPGSFEEPAPEPSSPADGPVTQLKGLGPKVAARLSELDIDRVGQLAALDDGQAAELDARMGPFVGRIARDRWIEQARLLAAGDRDGFERVFGKL